MPINIQDLVELADNFKYIILLVSLGAYIPKFIVNYFVANNIEKLFEDQKVKIVRNFIDEILLFIVIMSLVLIPLSSFAVFDINFELTFIFYLFLLLLASLIMFSYEDIKRLKSSKLIRIISFIKNRRVHFILLSILLSYSWLVISYISIASVFKPIADFNYSNSLELYMKLFNKYPMECILLYFLLLVFYFMCRFLIHTPYKRFILLGQSKRKISFTYDNEKYNDYFLLRVNNNKAYVCKESSFYSECAVMIFDKDKMDKISVKYYFEKSS